MHLIQTHLLPHYCFRVDSHLPQREELIHKSVVLYAHKALSAWLHFITVASSHSPPSCRREYSPFTQLTFIPSFSQLFLFWIFFIIWSVVFPQLLSELNSQSPTHNLEHLFTCVSVTPARGQEVQGLYDRLHYKCYEHGLEASFVCVPAYKVRSLRGPRCHGLQVNTHTQKQQSWNGHTLVTGSDSAKICLKTF